MIISQPIWLLLAIPLGVALWLWPLPTRLLNGIRILILALVLAALMGIVIQRPSNHGIVVIVADRSRSMPADSANQQIDIINAIASAKSSADQLAVVSFGQTTAIESLNQAGKFPGFVNVVEPDGSNLAQGLQTALAVIPADSPARILVLSDGRWTGSDPQTVVPQAASRDIAIDYRQIQRPQDNDTAIEQFLVPHTVSPGESFMITSWIDSSVEQQIPYQLTRNDQVISQGTASLHPGLNRLIFRDRAPDPSVCRYQLQITADSNDPTPENNTAKALTQVEGPKPILILTQTPESRFATMLQAGRLNVKPVQPIEARWSLEDLASYTSVIIENVSANDIGRPGMQSLAAWVNDANGGLMFTGGQSSYGTGGYFKSPLEPIMPVSMELRREHRKFSVAIVVALDRSGSMSMPVAGGKTKMDLADLGTVEVLNSLSMGSELGVIAVDSEAHTIASLTEVQGNESSLRSKILSIQSMGGGIYVYNALEAAAKMISQSELGTRHIVLFADAADSEQPDQYRTLLEKTTKAGITVSVIGLGLPTDSDADFLRDVAKRGGGDIYFTDDASELPRLFAQDTFVVARNAFLDEPTAAQITPAYATLTGTNLALDQAIGGYNLTYLRDDAVLAGVTLDEYAAPLVAAWRSGTGRVLCYTGEADGKFTGPIANWPSVGEFFSSLARWTAGNADNLPDNMLVTQQIQRGSAILTLHLDPQREGDAFSSLPRVHTLTGSFASPYIASDHMMQWVGPDELRLTVPLTGDDTTLSTVLIGDMATIALPPMCLPYSAEFQPDHQDGGASSLSQLALATSGKHRDILADIWGQLPRRPRPFDLSPYFLFAAIALFVLEILERRSGFLSFISFKRRAAVAAEAKTASGGAQKTAKKIIKPVKSRATPISPNTKPDETTPSAKPPLTPPPVPPASADLIDALRQARRSSRDRNKG